MQKRLTAALALLLGLSVPALPAGAAGLFSATGNVIAILDGELYVGQAEGHLDGAGTLTIHAQKNPALTCSGDFTSSAAMGGVGRLACSDGATSAFHFQRLSVFRGHGIGTFSRGAMSFVYGLTHEEARPYLQMPPGKQLLHNGIELAMVDL
jgi:hypothetical protein